MEEKVIEFYRRVVFGSDYTSETIQNKKMPQNEKESMIIGWCFNAAWADMSRHTLTLKNTNLTDKDKQSKRKEFKDLFKDIFNDFKNYKNNNDIKNKINQCIEIYKKKDQYFNFTFGQAQKLVNMFFKYLYTFKMELNLNDEYFNICDCPIDKINLQRIYNYEKNYKFKDKYVCYRNGTYCLKNKDSAVPWSKLEDKTVYNNIQSRIDEIIVKYNELNKEEKYKNRLDFEFAWE